jgi:hypothetical protein
MVDGSNYPLKRLAQVGAGVYIVFILRRELFLKIDSGASPSRLNLYDEQAV